MPAPLPVCDSYSTLQPLSKPYGCQSVLREAGRIPGGDDVLHGEG